MRIILMRNVAQRSVGRRAPTAKPRNSFPFSKACWAEPNLFSREIQNQSPRSPSDFPAQKLLRPFAAKIFHPLTTSPPPHKHHQTQSASPNKASPNNSPSHS